MLVLLSISYIHAFFDNATVTDSIEDSRYNGSEDLTVREVCYQHLGCFKDTDGPVKPTKRAIYLPEHPDKLATKFTLYTQDDRSNGVLVDYNETRSLAVINATQRLCFVVHGLGRESQPLVDLRKALLDEVPQVISVDWSRGSPALFYPYAATNTQIIGRQIAVIVEQLRVNYGLDPALAHVVGFSLGAQIAGFAGRWTIKQFGQKLGRISGKSS